MKIYVSGRISGLNQNFCRSVFDEAEQFLLSIGFDAVFNPMSTQGQFGTWEQYMRNDLKELMTCDAIFMLDGWELSKGARLEHHNAQQLGMIILYESERRNALVSEVKKIIAETLNISEEQITSKSRSQKLFFARMLTAVVLRQCKYSLQRIGAAINRDHSSVIYILRQHDIELSHNAKYRRWSEQVAEQIDKHNILNADEL